MQLQPSQKHDSEIDERLTAGSSASEGSLPLDEVFGVLSNHRRRHVLRILLDHDGPVQLDELATRIAAWETDKPVAEISSSERKRVYVGLYQNHLPKLSDLDVIEFNKPRGIVTPGDNLTVFEPYITNDTQPHLPAVRWERYYLGLSLFGSAVLVVSLFLEAVVAITVVEFVFAWVALLFLGVSVVHAVWARTLSTTINS